MLFPKLRGGGRSEILQLKNLQQDNRKYSGKYSGIHKTVD